MNKNLEALKPGPLVAGTPASGFDRFIELALNKQVPVETLERLLAMQKEIMAANAKAAYDAALSAFQAECPIIHKGTEVRNSTAKGGGLRYRYAAMDSIISQIREPLAKHGFSYDVDTRITEAGWIEAIVTATHVAGHSKTKVFSVPIDKDAFMNEQQKVAAARTYALRYCFTGIFGIMTGDEDDDAGSLDKDKTAPAPQQQKTPQAEQSKAPTTTQPTTAPTPGEILTASGGIVNITPLPMKNKPGAFRYKVELMGHEKPFYTFDKKVNNYLSKWASTGEVTITYIVGKHGQDIKDVSFADPNADFAKFCTEEAENAKV
jgi:hypothetical protein